MCIRDRPTQVGPHREAVTAKVVRRRLPSGGGERRVHRLTEPARRRDDRLVVPGYSGRQDDVEAAPAARPAVGVDRDGRGGVRLVADGGPPGDARTPAGVVPTCQHHLCPGAVEPVSHPLGYVEIERMLGVAVGGLCPDGVALLAAVADVDLGGDVAGVRDIAAGVPGVDHNDLTDYRTCLLYTSDAA